MCSMMLLFGLMDGFCVVDGVVVVWMVGGCVGDVVGVGVGGVVWVVVIVLVIRVRVNGRVSWCMVNCFRGGVGYCSSGV